MPFQIPITGRLVDPLGSGISGAWVYFTSKATTRGAESVPKTADAFFQTDFSGYYSASLASGWYKIDYQEPGWLEPQRLGVATVSGTRTLDLGTLIDNSLPPPTQLQNISDVNVSGRFNGAALVWNAARSEWNATGNLAAFTLTGNQRVISSPITAGTSGVAVTFSPAFTTTPKVQLTLSVTGENMWAVSLRGLSANGFTGQFSDIVTDSGATLQTFASL